MANHRSHTPPERKPFDWWSVIKSSTRDMNVNADNRKRKLDKAIDGASGKKK